MENNRSHLSHCNKFRYNSFDVLLQKKPSSFVPQYGAPHVFTAQSVKLDVADILLALHYKTTNIIQNAFAAFKIRVVSLTHAMSKRILRIKTQGIDHVP